VHSFDFIFLHLQRLDLKGLSGLDCSALPLLAALSRLTELQIRGLDELR
jgi:hypothetical protein